MFTLLKKRTLLSFWFFFTTFIISIILTPNIINLNTNNLGNEVYKLIYLHVPFAWLSLLSYIILGIFSIIYLITKNPTFSIYSLSNSIICFIFTSITLITGSIWAKPTWGTYWVWDARLTSMLILLIFITGIILLYFNTFYIEGSYLSLIGIINIPIVKYSVEWWTGLHQSSSISSLNYTIHYSILIPLLLWFVTFIIFYITLFFMIINNFKLKIIIINI